MFLRMSLRTSLAHRKGRLTSDCPPSKNSPKNDDSVSLRPIQLQMALHNHQRSWRRKQTSKVLSTRRQALSIGTARA
jgi:hypothetical protein